MRSVSVRTLAVLIALVSCASGAHAQSGSQAFTPFAEFLENVSHTTFERVVANEGAAVKSRAEFQAMRLHILDLYRDVEVVHSFALDGQTFDCVPVEQQPSFRALGQGATLADPPEPTVAKEAAAPLARRAPSPLTLGLTDAFGNQVRCDQGSIPMRRVTLEELSLLGTLEEFFRKTPFRVGSPEDLGAKASATHKYAHAFQNVKNYGGNSWLNLWSPAINTSAKQIFSLSQHWYVGGSGSALQTVEGGWQAYPTKYSTPKSVTFIYWTADAYGRTGCYNLDCAAFVQINNNWHLGGTWSRYSTKGGTQWEFQMQWKFHQGNWWLFLQGDGDYEAVGYYPGSLFKNGQLSKWATRIDYGGETVGVTTWPRMGSGSFAKDGFRQAAYQRLIFYITSAPTGPWASLSAVQSSPKCYSLKLTPVSSGGAWGTYFFFGGPGGKGC